MRNRNRTTDRTLIFDVPDLPIRVSVCVYSESVDMTKSQMLEEAHDHLRSLGINPQDVQLTKIIDHLEVSTHE